MQKQEEDLVAAVAEAQAEAAAQISWLTELDAAFSRTGIQSFAVEGVLGELQVSALLLAGLASSGTMTKSLASSHCLLLFVVSCTIIGVLGELQLLHLFNAAR